MRGYLLFFNTQPKHGGIIRGPNNGALNNRIVNFLLVSRFEFPDMPLMMQLAFGQWSIILAKFSVGPEMLSFSPTTFSLLWELEVWFPSGLFCSSRFHLKFSVLFLSSRCVLFCCLVGLRLDKLFGADNSKIDKFTMRTCCRMTRLCKKGTKMFETSLGRRLVIFVQRSACRVALCFKQAPTPVTLDFCQGPLDKKTMTNAINDQ